MTRPKKWPAWKDGGTRPKGWAPADYFIGRRAKLRKLVLQCQQNGDGRYHLPGTSFSMTIEPEEERELW